MSVEGYANLLSMYGKADTHDIADGLKAYIRYHDQMHALAVHYGFKFEDTVAAFCALSPKGRRPGPSTKTS